MEKSIFRNYKKEEIKALNYILDKPEDNKWFSEYELEVFAKVDLFDNYMVEMSRRMWKNRDNKKWLELIGKIIEDKDAQNFNANVQLLLKEEYANA